MSDLTEAEHYVVKVIRAGEIVWLGFLEPDTRELNTGKVVVDFSSLPDLQDGDQVLMSWRGVA